MPIMDGYRATYSIRNAPAFVADREVQCTPIVAMTASAIQGDREKCQKSGMDDYLAKPVKGKVLERMLVKWAIEGRRKRQEAQQEAMVPPSPTATVKPATRRNQSSFTSQISEALDPTLSSELDRLEFAHRAAAERSSESVNERALRHLQAEEKAIILRDDALIQSGENPKARLGRRISEDGHIRRGSQDASHALTAENMEKLAEKEQSAQNEATDEVSSVHVTLGGDNLSNAPKSDRPSPSTFR